MSAEVRVRFAPSPTGPLHIGGVRTALYNYLFAKKNNGSFILRIEDTDQSRYIKGAENYIIEALNWLGLIPNESVHKEGEYGPYRQSDRKDIYNDNVQKLIELGQAYYAFDSPEDLNLMRERGQNNGIHSPKYDSSVRNTMKNSLTLSPQEVQKLLEEGKNVTVRMKVPEDEIISFTDEIRGRVQFNSNELDDKVIMKGDGFPTYHLANVVDDKLMKISHVIRGEEWLSSTAHHVLLYRAFGWADTIPVFAHLPLIMKPAGKGKLSKRDGAKFGFPVFPLKWHDESEDETYAGFREAGFLPSAVINFLSLLGWNPGTDEEMFSLDQLCEIFSLDKIIKSGAQFNFDKAKWFNQQYIMATDSQDIFELIGEEIKQKTNNRFSDSFVKSVIDMLKPRVETISDFYNQGSYFWSSPTEYSIKPLKKKYKSANDEYFEKINSLIENERTWTSKALSTLIKSTIEKNGLKFGEILPVLRIWITGSMTGPDLFEMIELLGREETLLRLSKGLNYSKNNL